MAKLLCALVLCVMVMAHQPAAEAEGTGAKGKELIPKVCVFSPAKDLCKEVLSSDPVNSPNAQLRDLAIIALKVAVRNATDLLHDASTLIEDENLEPEVQQGLSDCKDILLDAESQLEDSIAALLKHDDSDANIWVKDALAAVETCDASIPGDDDILSVKSVHFRKLCNIAAAVSGLLDNPAVKF